MNLKKVFFLIVAAISLFSFHLTTINVFALSDAQLKIYQSGVGYFDNSVCSNTSTDGGSGSGANANDVITFASEPITSTWNISNSTAESWFLKQTGAQATISKYNLGSSNIGQVTSAVQAANVSPVLFYLITIEEGGGAGGFINHYGSDTSGGATGNATRDAQYIATESQTTANGPATGGGEPSDMPTAEAKNILDSLPKGSIGVYYIQATSAATAEIETISGKSGDWSGQFGSPLQDIMNNIKKMGGDPMKGGSTISSANGCSSNTGVSCGGSGKYSALVSANASFAGVDQGIDFVPAGSGGFSICAPASGTITQADQTGHIFQRTNGQAEIIEKLDQTPNVPNGSQYIYFAEIIQINSNITVGTHVNAGDILGTSSQSPGIEVGWALNDQYGFKCTDIGYPTACGSSFDSWIQGVSSSRTP